MQLKPQLGSCRMLRGVGLWTSENHGQGASKSLLFSEVIARLRVALGLEADYWAVDAAVAKFAEGRMSGAVLVGWTTQPPPCSSLGGRRRWRCRGVLWC